MSKARKGLEPGSHARVFRAGGGFGDSIGMYEVPDDGGALVIRDLSPGSYTARDELGNEVSFVQEAGAEDARVRVIGGMLEGTAEVTREEDVSPDVRAPAAPGTAIVTEAPDDPLAGLPGPVTGQDERFMTTTEKQIAEGAGGGDLRGEALDERVRELDIEGRSSMTADDKRRAVADAETEPEVHEPAPQPHRKAAGRRDDEALAAGQAHVEDPRAASGAGGGRESPPIPEQHDEDEIAGTS